MQFYTIKVTIMYHQHAAKNPTEALKPIKEDIERQLGQFIDIKYEVAGENGQIVLSKPR